jgi:hypothetical protein
MMDDRQTRKGIAPQSAVVTAEESDELVVPKKPGNARVTPAELVEGRSEAEGKLVQRNAPRTQGRQGVLTDLERVGQRAFRPRKAGEPCRAQPLQREQSPTPRKRSDERSSARACFAVPPTSTSTPTPIPDPSRVWRHGLKQRRMASRVSRL